MRPNSLVMARIEGLPVAVVPRRFARTAAGAERLREA
jgi:hypothetical protein